MANAAGPLQASEGNHVMLYQGKGRELYDKYLDALAEHTNVGAELRALELRHIQDDDDSASYIVESSSLRRSKQEAGQRYLDARKVYEDYKQARGETDQ